MKNREFYIDHDNIPLHAKLDFPADPKEKYPLLIIEHGYTGHMEERHIVGIAKAANEIGFAVLRIELYGHGQSGGAFKNHTVLKWVDEMMTVLDYAASLDFVSDIYLAGHSQGGLTAILTAGAQRDRIKALIPLAPAIIIRDAALQGTTFGVRFDPEHIPDEIVMDEVHTLSGDYFRAAQMLPVEEAIRRYDRPVLIVHADTDESVPVSYAEWAAGLYKDCTLKIIEGDTHCYDRKLEEVLESVTTFLKKNEFASQQ